MSKSVLCARSLSADPVNHVKRNQLPPNFTCRREIPLPLSHPCLFDISKPNSISPVDSLYESGASHVDSIDISDNNNCCKKLPSFPIYVDVPTILNVIKQLDDNEYLRMDCVLVDTRENRHYQTSHLRHACSASCYTKTMAKRSVAAWASNYTRQRPKDIYIYDQKTTSEQGVSNPHLQFFITYLQERGNRIYILDGGLMKFNVELPHEVSASLFESCIDEELVNRYTFSPTNAENKSVDVLNATASEIDSNLWLGNNRDAHDWELLSRIGITHVLNVTADIPNYFEHKRKMCYHRLHASDSHAQDLLQFFVEAHAFIDNAKKEGGRILVHCWAGVSRSATIIVSYLMHSFGCSPAEGLEYLRKKRSIVAPNLNFMGQLERFYEICKQRRQHLGQRECNVSFLWNSSIAEGSTESGDSDQSSTSSTISYEDGSQLLSSSSLSDSEQITCHSSSTFQIPVFQNDSTQEINCKTVRRLKGKGGLPRLLIPSRSAVSLVSDSVLNDERAAVSLIACE